ncbi:hypothetical protein H696_05872 [Fonticula alba]|uniref:Uncharacterized protein n=1 Tax=Fonticula alba TaxID=691883 RepID=A0A058Z034_FONAL|nr:hypothetical protein H696_05872 [Fonticula alba]KCV67605.1 hypothetical protein H696_05872 [Fonticula alba]|eukprot:XP_009497943.1 hypothetical protein H696_05872 [Fonticula alba]
MHHRASPAAAAAAAGRSPATVFGGLLLLLLLLLPALTAAAPQHNAHDDAEASGLPPRMATGLDGRPEWMSQELLSRAIRMVRERPALSSEVAAKAAAMRAASASSSTSSSSSFFAPGGAKSQAAATQADTMSASSGIPEECQFRPPPLVAPYLKCECDDYYFGTGSSQSAARAASEAAARPAIAASLGLHGTHGQDHDDAALAANSNTGSSECFPLLPGLPLMTPLSQEFVFPADNFTIASLYQHNHRPTFDMVIMSSTYVSNYHDMQEEPDLDFLNFSPYYRFDGFPGAPQPKGGPLSYLRIPNITNLPEGYGIQNLCPLDASIAYMSDRDFNEFLFPLSMQYFLHPSTLPPADANPAAAVWPHGPTDMPAKELPALGRA